MIFPQSQSPLLDINVQDEFFQQTTSASLIGELTWVSSMTGMAAHGSTAGHPGIWRFTTNTVGRTYNNYVNTPLSAFDGLTMMAVLKPEQVDAGTLVDFGAQQVNAYAGGRKILQFDKSLSDNWRLVHMNNDLTYTAVDTGVPAVADWTILQLQFLTGGTTVGYVKTAAAEGRVTTAAAITLGTQNHTPQFTLAGNAKALQVDLFRMWGTSTRL